MAVYTVVAPHEARALVARLGLGELIGLQGIAAGIENSNYFVDTDRGPVVEIEAMGLGEPHPVDLVVRIGHAVGVFEAVRVLRVHRGAVVDVRDAVGVVVRIRAAVVVLEGVVVLGLVRALVVVVHDPVAVAVARARPRAGLLLGRLRPAHGQHAAAERRGP